LTTHVRDTASSKGAIVTGNTSSSKGAIADINSKGAKSKTKNPTLTINTNCDWQALSKHNKSNTSIDTKTAGTH
jgi:hypothetical protein